LFAGRLGDLALAYNRVSSVLSGPMLGIFLLATMTRRATAGGVLLGALAGGATILAVSTNTGWSFFYYGPIGVLVTVGVGYFTSLLMQAPPDEKIRGLVVGYGDPALVRGAGAEPALLDPVS
jgi:Na+/proline symporter